MPGIRFVISAAALVAALATSAAQADEVAPVIVSAVRTPTPADQVAQSVTVLDAATLRLRQTTVVADALATTPGLSIVRNGGVGQTTTVHIRGAETEQTVVVLDGVRLNDPSSPGGGYDVSNLFAGDLGRIEVLRGPASTLWGADAIGGVIVMTTAAPTGALSVNGAAEAGSLDTRYLRLSASGVMDRLSWRAAGGYFQTSGVSAFAARLGGKEPDGALNAAGSLRLGYRLSDTADLDLRFAHVSAKTAFDGYPPPNYTLADTPEYGESRQTRGYVGLNLKGFGDAVKSRFSVQVLRIDRDNFDPTTSPDKTFYARGLTRTFAWQGDWTVSPRLSVQGGLESARSHLRTAAPASYDPNPAPLKADATLDSAFVNGRFVVLKGLTLSAGVRDDHHSRFGDHATVSAGLAYTPDEGATQFRASFGQGFKAPTLYQLYGDYGFTGLKPETANGADIGASRRLLDGRLSLGASVFQRDVKSQIGFFDCYSGVTPQCATRPYGYYANLDRTRATGWELSGELKPLTGVTLTGAYTHTDAENRDFGAYSGKALPRRPKDTASAEGDWRLANGAVLSLGARYAGESFDNLSNTRKLKAYTLVDLRTETPLTAQLALYGRIENLFDRTYETASGFGSVGRTAMVGVRARY